MRQFWFLFSIGILAVGLGGCGSKPEETATTPSPTTSPATSPSAVASPNPNATPTPGQTPPFKDPLVKEQSNVAAGAGLIQSTNSEERLRLLGKPSTATSTAPLTTTAPSAVSIDPFAVLPPSIVQAAPEVGKAPTVPEQTTREVPQLPKIPDTVLPSWRTALQPSPTIDPNNQRDVPTLPSAPRTTLAQWGGGGRTPGRKPISRPNDQPVVVPALPGVPIKDQPVAWRDPSDFPPGIPPVAGQPFSPPLPSSPPVPAKPLVPPPPATDLAQGVEVTGILQVGNQTKIILKAPNEPTSRYVAVGQRVSNGQVLVKRVKFDTRGEPIVIFEQNGIEIAKSVGALNPPTDQKINNISMRSSAPVS